MTRWTRARLALPVTAILGALFGTGCYWSSPPSTPHRSSPVDLDHTPMLAAPVMPRLSSPRLVLLGRFDTTAPNPVGGLYDRDEYDVSPLYRTYFFKDGAVELFEHASDALRASGLEVLKDYATHAQPAVTPVSVRARSLILVTATVLSLQHDQIRQKGKQGDFEVGRLEVQLHVADGSGGVRLDKRYLILGKVFYAPQTDFLKLLGWKLAEVWARDPEFTHAIEGQPRGAT